MTIQRMGNRRTIVLLISLYTGLAFFLGVTNPRDLPIIVLLLPLVWLFGCLLLTGLVIMRWLNLFPGETNKLRRAGYSAIVAGLPVGLLLLRSIDQLTARDISLIVILSATVMFYIGRLRFGQKMD